MKSAAQILTLEGGSMWWRAHLLLVLAMSGLSCSENPAGPDPLPPLPISAAILDGAHDGAQGFYFLPPMVAAPKYDGVFEIGYAPVVTICEWNVIASVCGEEVVRFGLDFGHDSEVLRLVLQDEHYIVNWHLDRFDLTDGATYRSSVTVEGHLLGFADVVLFSSMKEARSTNNGESIALLDGRTLPIKFRIEETAIPAAALALDPGAVAFEAYAGGGDPDPAVVHAANLGLRPLGEVALGTIEYSGDIVGWIEATVAGSAAPTDLTIRAMTAGLVPGTYHARVPVTATTADNSPQTVDVTFEVVLNTLPTASAGADQEVGPGVTVVLDGSGSTDADEGQSLTYAWSQTEGPEVVLSATDVAMPTFEVPAESATLEFSLVVSDGIANSEPDGVVVTVVEPEITIISPAPGVTWLQGETHTIEWTSTGLGGQQVGISLLSPGGGTVGIASFTEDDGSESWLVPTILDPGTYDMVVATLDGAVAGTSVFHVGAPPVNEIMSARVKLPEWLPNEHSVEITYSYVTDPGCTGGATLRVVPVSSSQWGDGDATFPGQTVWLGHERDMPAGTGTINFNIQKISGSGISKEPVKVGMFCAGAPFPFFEQDLPDVRLAWYPSGDAPFYVRNWSQFDVNEVRVMWQDQQDQWQDLLWTSNLSLWRNPSGLPYGSHYDDQVLGTLKRRHALSAEPDVERYYHVRYVQERRIEGGEPVYWVDPFVSPALAVGVHHLPGYAILRETYFIFDPASSFTPGYRFEQVLRGPDGRVYVNRPWYEPSGGDLQWPMLLEDLIATGYSAYQLSEFDP